jgi:hypothetical protein
MRFERRLSDREMAIYKLVVVVVVVEVIEEWSNIVARANTTRESCTSMEALQAAP